jgi:hypothetical protein
VDKPFQIELLLPVAAAVPVRCILGITPLPPQAQAGEMLEPQQEMYSTEPQPQPVETVATKIREEMQEMETKQAAQAP